MRDIWEYLEAGGFFMLVIGICSLFALTVVLYKALMLKRRNVIADDTVMALRAAMDLDNRSGRESLRASLSNDDTPLARIASAAASPRLQNREEAVALVRRYDHEFPRKFFPEFLTYLGLEEDEFFEIADSFRSPHLWRRTNEGWDLRHKVA